MCEVAVVQIPPLQGEDRERLVAWCIGLIRSARCSSAVERERSKRGSTTNPLLMPRPAHDVFAMAAALSRAIRTTTAGAPARYQDEVAEAQGIAPHGPCGSKGAALFKTAAPSAWCQTAAPGARKPRTAGRCGKSSARRALGGEFDLWR